MIWTRSRCAIRRGRRWRARSTRFAASSKRACRVPEAVRAAAVRRDSRRGIRRRLHADQGSTCARSGRGTAESGGALRDAARPSGAGGLRRVSAAVGQALCAAWWCSATRGCCGCSSTRARRWRCCSRARRGVRLLRRRARGTAVRPDEGGHRRGPARERRRLVENPEFLRFAAHWGFRIRACRPYRAKTKGKVERPIRYVRESFFYGRTFLNDADLNAQALRWLDRRRTREPSHDARERLASASSATSAPLLKPLAPAPYPSLPAPASGAGARSHRIRRRPSSGVRSPCMSG